VHLAVQSEDNGVTRISSSGRITQDQLAKIPDPIGEVAGTGVYSRKVLLDMSGTEFLDSSGVSWLLVSHKKFQEENGRLIIHSVPPIVLNVIKILRMNLVFELADNEDAALKKIREEA
jgi:anti-anti-sigma factor